jgi:hypothetical protein
MLVCISFAGGYENREKEKKEEKNCMYGANCKYYEQFFIINNNHRTWKGERINRGRKEQLWLNSAILIITRTKQKENRLLNSHVPIYYDDQYYRN